MEHQTDLEGHNEPSAQRPRRHWVLALILGCAAVGMMLAAWTVMHAIELRGDGCTETWSDRSETVYNVIGISTPFCAAALVLSAILLVSRGCLAVLLALVAAAGTFFLVGFITVVVAYEIEGCF